MYLHSTLKIQGTFIQYICKFRNVPNAGSLDSTSPCLQPLHLYKNYWIMKKKSLDEKLIQIKFYLCTMVIFSSLPKK